MKVREICYTIGMGGCHWKHNMDCIKPKGEICPATCTKSIYKRKKSNGRKETEI